MDYKMVALDIDGTLLPHNKEISDANKIALKKAQEKGVKIALSTGRLYGSASLFSEIMGVECSIIAANGSYIKDQYTKKVIYKKTLDEENVKSVLNICSKLNTSCYLFTRNTLYTEKSFLGFENDFKHNKLFPKEKRVNFSIVNNDDWEQVINNNKDNIFKAFIIDKDKEKIKYLRKYFENLDVDISSSGSENLEVISKGISKGPAVDFLAKSYNIKKDEIICMGDSENDISMIRYAGLGIAMGNASDEVKKYADFVTLSDVDDGVAYAVNKFILNE